MDENAFWYVDGDPLKGKWIDMEHIDSTDEILEELAEAGFVPRDEDGDPEYDGDLLVADIEGPLCTIAYGRYGAFDLELFMRCRDSGIEPEILHAFVECFGELPGDLDKVTDAYRGQYGSWKDFAESLLEETGEIESIPDSLRYYFDYEKYANDIRLSGDVSEHDNHYFWSNW